MPDLMTHFTSAYLISRTSSFSKYRGLLYLGVILPDIISRPVYILFPGLAVYTLAMHTPMFLFLFILFISELFDKQLQMNAIKYLSLGTLMHLLLDLMQRHLTGGYYWFFPFTWKSFELGWFWPETPLKLLPLWIAGIVIVELIYFIKHKKLSFY